MSRMLDQTILSINIVVKLKVIIIFYSKNEDHKIKLLTKGKLRNKRNIFKPYGFSTG